MQTLHGSYAHCLHELGSFYAEDLGTYELAGYVRSSTGTSVSTLSAHATSSGKVTLLQAVPASLSARQCSSINNLKQFELAYRDAPGVAYSATEDDAIQNQNAVCFVSCRFQLL